MVMSGGNPMLERVLYGLVLVVIFGFVVTFAKLFGWV
jgi:hypothetical protein